MSFLDMRLLKYKNELTRCLARYPKDVANIIYDMCMDFGKGCDLCCDAALTILDVGEVMFPAYRAYCAINSHDDELYIPNFDKEFVEHVEMNEVDWIWKYSQQHFNFKERELPWIFADNIDYNGVMRTINGDGIYYVRGYIFDISERFKNNDNYDDDYYEDYWNDGYVSYL